MERDLAMFSVVDLFVISTHTLTWSVTAEEAEEAEEAEDFNSHAHVERDEPTEEEGEDNADFNSHAHVERDLRMIAGN